MQHWRAFVHAEPSARQAGYGWQRRPLPSSASMQLPLQQSRPVVQAEAAVLPSALHPNAAPHFPPVPVGL
jgi:hypothetical protein